MQGLLWSSRPPGKVSREERLPVQTSQRRSRPHHSDGKAHLQIPSHPQALDEFQCRDRASEGGGPHIVFVAI